MSLLAPSFSEYDYFFFPLQMYIPLLNQTAELEMERGLLLKETHFR